MFNFEAILLKNNPILSSINYIVSRSLVWHMCLLPAPISLCINTTECADTLSYGRDWLNFSDIEMTSVA